MVASMTQCLASGLHNADESCRPFLTQISLPTPLEPLVPSSFYYAMLTTPLFLLGLSLLLLSLLASHLLSKTPIKQLGHVGTRGRRNFSWNEATTGDGGGRFVDFWIFGGSVWIRAWHCIWDLIAGIGGDGGDDEGDESGLGGENLFACFGVAHHDDVVSPDCAKADEVKGHPDSSSKKRWSRKTMREISWYSRIRFQSRSPWSSHPGPPSCLDTTVGVVLRLFLLGYDTQGDDTLDGKHEGDVFNVQPREIGAHRILYLARNTVHYEHRRSYSSRHYNCNCF